RAIGEGAPLIVVGAATIMSGLPNSLTSSFTALPLQIFYWTSKPQADFVNVAAAASIVLVIILVLLNSIAIIIRNKYSRK
ncbi:MAG: phosphate ABC transporter permease PstA, partial [Bacilli bacterium]